MELQVPADLPEDIARLIFEAAAEIRSQGLACTCAILSKQVKAWVEPVLYRDVVVGGDGRFYRTVTASVSTKPPNFFATHVKSLRFNTLGSHDESTIPNILEKCSSIRSLAIWIDYGHPELRDALASPRLAPTHLSLGGRVFGDETYTPEPPAVKFSHPLFRNATHLEILWERGPWEWSSLHHIKQLTHLNLVVKFKEVNDLPDLIASALSHAPPTLRTVIVSSGSMTRFSNGLVSTLAGIDPTRIVVAPRCASDPMGNIWFDVWREQWDRPSSASCTVWTLADGVLRKRRSSNCQTVIW